MFGQLEAELHERKPSTGGDHERDDQLQRSRGWPARARRQQLPQALPVDQRTARIAPAWIAMLNRSERAPSRALGDQQVAGAGDRQEFGDAFDDAEQDDADEVVHGFRFEPYPCFDS